jgi:hypothetical protein
VSRGMSIARRLIGTAALFATLAVAGPTRAGDAPRTVDVIENDLVADDPAVRAKAAAELTDRFPDGAVAVPMLVDLLDDESPDVVAAAAKAIDSMAVAGAARLTTYLTNDANWMPGSPLASRLPVLLDFKTPTFALSAFDPIREQKHLPMQSGELAIASVLAARSESPRALFEWAGCSPTPKLLDAMHTSDEVRPIAASALAMHGADALIDRGISPQDLPGRAAAVASAVVLARSDLDVRSWAGSQILTRLRPADPAIVAVLMRNLSTPKTATRMKWGDVRLRATESACRALGRIGPPAASTAEKLVDLASKKETNADTVKEAATALLRMDKESVLVALFESGPPTADVLRSVLAANHRAASIVVPVLIATLKESSSGSCVEELEEYGPEASAALPALKAHPATASFEVARFLRAILAISPSDVDAIRRMDSLLADTNEQATRDGLDVLAARSPAGPSLVAKLQSGLARRWSDPPKIETYYDAIGRCGAAAKPLVADLVRSVVAADELCRRPEYAAQCAVRRHVIVIALGRIGPDAAAAVPALTALRDKGDETIRVAAAQALRRIRAKK